ncbi:MAG: tRNA (adenosine(37)-N6)-threonylcarbamoyltransferase complex ATPase subunit type 1 TsaE [Mycoplasmatales bacterium]
MKKIKTKSEEELIKVAFDFSSFLKKGDIIFLQGELGAGKTTFVKGVAKYLKITKPITSPTYTIIKEYDNKLCHVDAYRINLEDIGLDYYIQKGDIIAIEWFENLESYLKPNYLIQINYSNEGREVIINEY